LRSDEQLETGGSIGAVLRRHTAQVSIDVLCGAAHVTAVEREFGAAEQCEPVCAGLVEHCRGFRQTALATAQLREADDRVRRHRRAARREFLAGSDQFLLRLHPGAAPHADGGVLRAADGKQRPQPPLCAEHFQAGTPLNGTVVIPNAFAGGNHVAARQRNRDEVLQLAGDNCRVHLVEAPHAFRDGARGDERESLDRHAKHFEIDVADLARDANPFRGQPVRPVRIAIFHQTQRSFPDIEPGLFGTFWKAGEQASRALQPAVGDCVLAAECPCVPGEPNGYSRGRLPIAPLAVQAVGTFARIEDGFGVIEPPRGERESLERLRTVALAQHRLKRAERIRPRAARQVLVASGAISWTWGPHNDFRLCNSTFKMQNSNRPRWWRRRERCGDFISVSRIQVGLACLLDD